MKYCEALDDLRQEAVFLKGPKTIVLKSPKTNKTIDEQCDVLQELINKEIPMKIIDHRDRLGGQAFCSKCFSTIFDLDEPLYCSNCGQRLKWSEDND